MKKLTYIFLLASIALLSACERDVTGVEVPKVNPELVVFSFISPEEFHIKVNVSLSRPIFGKPTPNANVNNAVVTLSNANGQKVTLPYADTIAAYYTNQNVMPIEPGKTYTLEVEYSNYKTKATCTVPLSKPEVTEIITTKLADPNSGNNGPFYIYNYKFNDVASKKNYYRVMTQYYSAPGSWGPGYYSEICGSFYDDEGFEGKTISGKCEDYSFSSIENKRYFFLLNTDVHYYEYMRRRVNYFGDDPFSEPSPQYNNMIGGLGVFASYRMSIKEFLP